MVGRSWLVGVAVVAGAVRAASAEPVRITYAAPAGCPDEADVVARLADKANARRADRGPARVFAIAIARDDAGFHGTIAIDGVAREVAAGTCEEVVDALVIVAALAVEERAPAVPPPVVIAPAPHREPERWYLVAGAGVARYAGMTPSARLGVPVYVAARHGHSELRATFDATTRDDLAMASFRWTAGRLEGCPYVATAGAVDVAPCAGVQLGVLEGEGTAIAEAGSDTRPWIAPDAALRIRARAGRAAVELEGTLAVPVVRDRYYIAPANTIHEVPWLAYGLGASLAFEFR